MTWGIRNPSSIELYRDRTAASAPVTLRRKRCACNKVVTAKQLQQHGMCDTCLRVGAGVKEAA